MTFLQVAAFTSDLPDDQIEDGYDIVQFGGKGVSEAIITTLRDLSYKVGELDEQGERGWAFSVGSAGQEAWLLLSHLGDHIMLQVEDTESKARHPQYGQFRAGLLHALTNALNDDGRFHDLLWFAEVGDALGFADPMNVADASARRPAPEAWNWA